MTPATCEHCGKAKCVLVAMEPGRDRQPWNLCVRCWLDGVRPMNEAKAAAEAAASANPADLPPSAKTDVGDFGRPKKRARGART